MFFIILTTALPSTSHWSSNQLRYTAKSQLDQVILVFYPILQTTCNGITISVCTMTMRAV